MARMSGAVVIVGLVVGVVATPATARGQTPSQGQPLRLAYINSQLILANTPGRAEAESAFVREMASFRAEVQRLQQRLDSAVAEYNRTSLVLSPAAKQQREQEIRQLEQQARQRAAELDQQASQREAQLTAPIMQRVNAVIEGVRAEFNYSMIFDAAAQGGGLVTADRSLDISALVIQRLQAGGANPPGPAQDAPGALQPSATPPLRPQPADTTRRTVTPPRTRRP